MEKPSNITKAVFGGGCFWCTEAIFKRLKGVEQVVSGYAGGAIPNPSYERVSVGTSGHVEVIEVTFDSDEISYDQLLDVFFATHDPTSLDKQGHDQGYQYKSILFVINDSQREQAEAKIAKLNQSGEYGKPLVTVVKPLETFYKAEDYHQNYYDQNKEQPYCQVVINPKLDTLFTLFPELLKEKK